MKIGLCLPQLGPFATLDAVRGFAGSAESLGFDSLWVQEHLFYPQPAEGYAGAPGVPWPEAYAQLLSPLELLSFVAGITGHIRLGTSILVTAYHRPLALAKQVATLDVLSGGRFQLGLGLGWCEPEYQLMDTPFTARGPRSRDFIRALQCCLGPDPVEYRGVFFDIPACLTSPKPVNGSLPLIGGFWSEAGLRRTAEYCDAWMPAGMSVSEAAVGIKAINGMARDDFCRAPLDLVYRVFSSPQLAGIAATAPGPLSPNWQGSVDSMRDKVEEAAAAGVSELIIDTSFFAENPGVAGWLAQPEFFAPLLEVVRA
ncbi:MAG: TIGR03619 family F420-dependent LLM class oxidoreductase [Gammaproteobacteria bacterium]|nr:TIGR03619 family F420-dependent LLM class oxidoreductase [Gammaproteobacteria bacterium]